MRLRPRECTFHSCRTHCETEFQLTTSRWYTASSSTRNEAGPSRTTPPVVELGRPNKRIRHHEALHQYADPESDRVTIPNPYATAISHPARPGRGSSPHYSPASPIVREASLRPPEGSTDIDLDYPATRNPPAVHPPAPPSVGLSAVEGISEHDATAYAMSSQYWAGYWMGVAQSMRHRRNDELGQGARPPSVAAIPEAESRIMITRRDFGNGPREGLRR